MKFLKSLLIVCSIYGVHTVKILGVFPPPTGSHYILGSTLMNALAEKGHDVTFIAPFKNKNPPKNGTFREIILTGNAPEILNQMKFYERESVNPISAMITLNQLLLQMTEDVLTNPEVQQLINSNEKFDVVIAEEFMNQAHRGLSYHFNASLIAFSPVGACHLVNTLVANPSPLSYIPEIILSYSPDMTFYQRFVNSVSHLLFKVVQAFYVFPNQEKLLRKYLPNSPDLHDLIYNVSLVLLNSHPSINQPVPLVPNMIEIGGYHVKPPKKLPEELQEFLDSAKDGVIYFSMGSHLKSAELPLEKREAFLKTFSKLKERVLWKWEDEELPGKPANVELGKWLPQQDILAHPNVKLFITHGGLLSTIETVYHGVPTLTIPVLGDQKTNAARAANYGYALVLPFSEITEEKLSGKISEMLDNPRYRESAKFRSMIFHDQQVKPMDKAIYWVEYIARHGRAEHLKVAGINLPWYKYHLLDVISFAFLIVLTINFGLFLIIKSIYFGMKSKLSGLEKKKKMN